MFFFVMPRADGTVYHLTLGGRDIEHAFEEFAKSWWCETDHTRSIGVWHDAALTARILPIYNQQTGKLEPFMQELRP